MAGAEADVAFQVETGSRHLVDHLAIDGEAQGRGGRSNLQLVGDLASLVGLVDRGVLGPGGGHVGDGGTLALADMELAVAAHQEVEIGLVRAGQVAAADDQAIRFSVGRCLGPGDGHLGMKAPGGLVRLPPEDDVGPGGQVQPGAHGDELDVVQGHPVVVEPSRPAGRQLGVEQGGGHQQGGGSQQHPSHDLSSVGIWIDAGIAGRGPGYRPLRHIPPSVYTFPLTMLPGDAGC